MLSKPRRPLMPGERKMWKEDFYDESKIICKTHLRKVQNHQKKRQYQSNLRESKAQTAPGIILQSDPCEEIYLCGWALCMGRDISLIISANVIYNISDQDYSQWYCLKRRNAWRQSIWKAGFLSGWIWKTISHLGKCQRAPIKKRPELWKLSAGASRTDMHCVWFRQFI